MPPFWQYGLPNVSDDLAAFAMMNGTTPGSPEREQMIVDTVRRQRDRRGWSRNPLLDPTREADEEAARLRDELSNKGERMVHMLKMWDEV